MPSSSNIIVVGYPKSGSTWITRLVADLVDSPVSGFLYYPENNVDVEGLDRPGHYQCYKSHQQLHELKPEDLNTAKIIYVIRDPRDISLSARSFFKYYKHPPSPTDSTPKRFLKRLINKFNRAFNGKIKLRNLTNDAILNGNEKLHYWCRVSWQKHLTPYLESEDVLKIKFEDALEDPLMISKKMLTFLNEAIDESSISKSIERQSFNTVKSKFNAQEDLTRANFLRIGKSEQWKTKMDKEEIQKFETQLKLELDKLGYPIG